MIDKKENSINSETIFEILKNFIKRTELKNLGYLPRWIILLIDITLVLFAAIVTHFLLEGIGLEYVNPSKIYYILILFISVHIFFFWRFRTYSGIIRHSSLIDAVQLFISESSVLITLYFVNIGNAIFFNEKLFLNTRLLISCIISYCFLLSFRILVKLIFEKYINKINNTNQESVLIYGTDDRAVSIANSLLTEKSSKYKLIGFININNKATTNRILNLPIHNVKRRVSVLARSLGASSIIIADSTMNNEDKINIIDDCLAYNIQVLSLPPLMDANETKNISSKIRNIKIEDLLERKPIILDTTKISSQLENKTVLISGAAGSIGSEIVWQVAKFNPSKIILVDQAETPLHNISLEMLKSDTTAQIISKISDIRDINTLEKIFEEFKPNVVYHAAAYKHVPLMEENPSQAILTNVLGTKNLADLSIKYSIARFVMVSTDKAVNPSNVMGCSKRIAEKYVQSLSIHLKEINNTKTKFITTRFGNVLGSNGSVVPLFSKQIENGGPITITHPDIIRYFMTIPEACQLVLEAGSMGNGGEIYIFDMGKPVKIVDLAKKMIKLAGLIPEVDIKIKVVGLRPGEKLYEELLNDTSTTLATYHEKIMIAHDQNEKYETIQNYISELTKLTKEEDKNCIVKKMKEIVPEFKSMNSEFEKLD